MTSSDNSVELKACPTPWCSSDLGAPYVFARGPARGVCCPVCSVSTRYFESREEAITAWNTRLTTEPLNPPSDEDVERVAAALKAERVRVRRENDAALAAEGFWPDHHKQPTDEQYARAAIQALEKR